MAYIKEVCKAGCSIEVRKYHTWRYPGVTPPEGKRCEKSKLTTEQQMAINVRKAKTEMRRLLNHNFHKGDYLLGLDYRKDERPQNSVQMQKHVSKFLSKLRYKCKKAGITLKYLYVKEIGKRGAAHVHMVINEIPIKWIREAWMHGGIDVKPLYTSTYEDIAEYFSKYSNKTIETEGQLIGKRYYPSRTLLRPKVTKKIISSKSFNKRIKEIPGYSVDKNRTFEGTNILGYRYMEIAYIRDE